MLSSPRSQARARRGHEAEGCAPWGAARGLPLGPAELPVMLRAATGLGENQDVFMPQPITNPAAHSPPPPRAPGPSRDLPLAQSLPLVPERPPAARYRSRVLASSWARRSQSSQLPPHLTASHRSPQREVPAALSPPTATQEAEPGLGRERKTGRTQRRPAAFLLCLRPPRPPTARLQALPCLSCGNSMGFCNRSSN